MKIAIVYFDTWVEGALGHPTVGRAFFVDAFDRSTPNSTMRLNAMNVAAWTSLQLEFDLDFINAADLTEDLTVFEHYSKLIINSIASDRFAAFIRRFRKWWLRQASPPELVFGTEYSWFNQIKSGKLTEAEALFPYKHGVVLRHTSRTDRFMYQDPSFRDCRVLEFGLGVDIDAVVASKDNVRDLILFVAGPEGRITKNNDEIREIVPLLESSDVMQKLSLKILVPPYRPTEYWDLLQRTKYLVFTSRGETFSYVLHDALASGVVCFRRPELFSTRLSRFGVDSYPDVGVRYCSPSNVRELIERWEQSDELVVRESYRSRILVEKRYSLNSLVQRWRKVLLEQDVLTSTLIMVGSADVPSHEIDGVARQKGTNLVFYWKCRGVDQGAISSYSSYDNESGLVSIPDFRIEAGPRERYVRQGFELGGSVQSTVEDEAIEYFRMLFRTHQIGFVHLLGFSDDLVEVRRIIESAKVFDGNKIRSVVVTTE